VEYRLDAAAVDAGGRVMFSQWFKSLFRNPA
jgi:hypothetical protein